MNITIQNGGASPGGWSAPRLEIWSGILSWQRLPGVSVRTLRNKITEFCAEGVDVSRCENRADGNFRRIYFSELLIEENLVLSLTPIPFTTDSNDRERYPSRDQAILDGGGASFVGKELVEDFHAASCSENPNIL
jgi:hypothetical protein